MPGKVNPAQCEALAMVWCQVIGNDVAITITLAPRICYNRAAQIAKLAQHDGTTLKQAALQLDFVSEEDVGAWSVPQDMTRPGIG